MSGISQTGVTSWGEHRVDKVHIQILKWKQKYKEKILWCYYYANSICSSLSNFFWCIFSCWFGFTDNCLFALYWPQSDYIVYMLHAWKYLGRGAIVFHLTTHRSWWWCGIRNMTDGVMDDHGWWDRWWLRELEVVSSTQDKPTRHLHLRFQTPCPAPNRLLPHKKRTGH